MLSIHSKAFQCCDRLCRKNPESLAFHIAARAVLPTSIRCIPTVPHFLATPIHIPPHTLKAGTPSLESHLPNPLFLPRSILILEVGHSVRDVRLWRRNRSAMT